MKKFFLKIIAVAAVFSLVPFASACTFISYMASVSTTAGAINERWGLDLPTGMDTLYSYTDAGWFGDGAYYYVFSLDKESAGLDFTAIDERQIEEIDSLYDVSFAEVESGYRIDTQNTLTIYYDSLNGGNDVIYAVYDDTLCRLTIMETHS